MSLYKFSRELEEKYPIFKKTEIEYEAVCTSCNVVISVASKGKACLDQHLASIKHNIKMQAGHNSKKIDSFVMQHTTLHKNKLSGEATHAFHIPKQHQSFRSYKSSTESLKRKLSDSKSSSRMSSVRPKTNESIVNNMIVPQSSQRTLDCLVIMDDIPFVGVCMDRLDYDAMLFPILVQFFDKKLGITHKLIEMASLYDEKEDSIYTVLTTTLAKTNLKEKCIAFTGNNCNINFAGVDNRQVADNNVFQHLQNDLQKPLIGIDCPAHILNNCVQHVLDRLPIDIESIVLKIYNYFSIYTVRTDTLKDFCNLVEADYKNLLIHSKSRWLYLFPAVNKLLEVYPALKSYFLSLEHAPVIIINFLENPLNEIYLWFIQSLMYIFYAKIEMMEKENHSILELKRILCLVEASLIERKEQEFLPLKVKQIIEANEHNNFRSKAIKDLMLCIYERAIQYLQKWTHFKEFKIFEWILLENKPLWDNIAECVEYLVKRGLEINDSMLFDQYLNLNDFFDQNECDEEFSTQSADLKWVKYFSQRTEEASSEILKICSFFFAIPAHNMNTERFFSMMKANSWTDKQNMLIPRGILNKY